MIEISLDRDEYDKIISAMTSLSQLRANNALNSAINKTAREASTRLKDAAKERYIVKASKLNKAESIRRASSFSDGAEIKYRASPESIANFKTRRRKILGVAAQVLNRGYLKDLEVDGRKAFVVGVGWRSKSGSSGTHVGVFQRKTEKKYPIRQIVSIAASKMIGNTHVVQVQQQYIKDDLVENMRSALAAASPAFATVTSSARTPFETSGRTNTSSTRSFGRATSVTSCQMPMISPPHMEPAGITRRPTPSRSSKSFCPRTPTRSSNVSPGFTRSVTSASNGRNSSKFSAAFFPLTRTTHSPATASNRTAIERPDQSDGTVTERRSQPIL